MPNFLIVGAAKSGTTSLYHYLNQHPQIFMSPVKEPRFFAFEGTIPDFSGPGDHRENATTITSIEQYQALFQGVTDEKAVGEASPPYLYIPGTAERIASHIPDAKLIAILRHPAERAFSNYFDKRLSGDEPHDQFSRALDEEPKRIAENWSFSWHYAARGYYYRQLKPYFDAFPRSQIRVFLYDELEADAAALVTEAFRFLEVDPSFSPNVEVRYRVSGKPKSEQIQKALRGSSRLKSIAKRVLPDSMRVAAKARLQAKNVVRQSISVEDRARLTEEYRSDIERLADLLDRDLSNWLEVPEGDTEAPGTTDDG